MCDYIEHKSTTAMNFKLDRNMLDVYSPSNVVIFWKYYVKENLGTQKIDSQK